MPLRYGLPEAGGVEQFDDEEVAGCGLDALANLAEQMGLARSRRPTHDDAKRRGGGVTGGVAEGIHHIVNGVFVETGDVRRRLRSPQVIDGRGPCQPQRCERLALRFGYHGSMARRCLA